MKTLAQLTYEAWCDGNNIDHMAQHPWELLSKSQQQIWIAVADTIRKECINNTIQLLKAISS